MIHYPQAEVDQPLAEGLIHAHVYGSDIRVWVRTARGCAKDHICQICGVEIKKGIRVYRPISNGNDRMYRFCILCAERLSR